MDRPLWTGSISFGLVDIPVRLFPAASPGELRFRLLHDADQAPLRERRFCSRDGEEVSWEHVVKGYELEPGRFIPLRVEEIEALAPPSSRRIEISEFVDPHEIDPGYFDATYYLLPGPGGDRAYALLREALRRSRRVGIARVMLRTRESLCAVRPWGRALAITTLAYAHELLSAGSLPGLPEEEPDQIQVLMAQRLIDTMSAPFQPGRYRDQFREQVLELIWRKSGGQPGQQPEPPPYGPPGGEAAGQHHS
jgi:DNA end-binding protein Ku